MADKRRVIRAGRTFLGGSFRPAAVVIEDGRIADKEFHAALLRATANPFIVSLTNGVTAAVNALTEFKQRIAPLKRDPAPDHWRVYDAIAAKDAEGARVAMTELIRLAIMDTPTKQRPRPAAAGRVIGSAHHLTRG